MISDTLSDAAAEIREYLTQYPQVYAGQLDNIVALLAAMDHLRRILDTPPYDDATDLYEQTTRQPAQRHARQEPRS